jgi:hypothetical protein
MQVLACTKKEAPKTPVTVTLSPLSENYPSLAVQAKAVNDALASGDFARFLDLTYPKVIEMAGGREKMQANIKKELTDMEAEGVRLLSSATGEPSQFVHDSGSIFAVLPVTLRIKAQTGVFQSEGSMIGVSADSGLNWTFIDASGKDQKELSSILPNTISKLTLPPDKPPVKIADK